MKKAAGSVRIDLAQYREMEVFTQFSSDLDPATKAQLAYGSGLMELLKQPLEHPLSMEEQVVILYAATSHLLVDIPKGKAEDIPGRSLRIYEKLLPAGGRCTPHDEDTQRGYPARDCEGGGRVQGKIPESTGKCAGGSHSGCKTG